MPATPKHKIVTPVAHAKGIDALPVSKQNELIEAFGLPSRDSHHMTRQEKLGFAEARLMELKPEGAVQKLSHDNETLFDRIADILGVEPPPVDIHWTERLQRVNAVEGKIAALGI